MSQRLGVLGGTFDPIHHGHLVAAQEACHQLALDRVVFVPVARPHHKAGSPVADGHHRLHMIERAITGTPAFSISRLDLDRAGPCYTVDTLRLLRAEMGPAPALFFIQGSDSLAEILTWHQPGQILELCELAVVRRPNVTIDLVGLEQQLPGLTARIHWIHMPLLEISSSDLRGRVREGRPISYLVPLAVEHYIQEQRLYHKAP